MPARCSVRPLRLSCMRTIAAHYDLLCYGCRTRHQMAALLEAEADEGPGYQDFPGPFTSLPASLLEDLVTVVSDTRGLLKQMLHQLLLPQLESYTIRSRSSKHIQTKLLSRKCRNLKHINFTDSKSIDPTFYTKFFTNFPKLVIINVQGTILDNEAFHSIGATCGQLRELNAAGSTLTDAGLQLLQGAAPRLLSLDISATRTSAPAVAAFLRSHPGLLTLQHDHMGPVLDQLLQLDQLAHSYSLRQLSVSGSPVSRAGLVWAAARCPRLESLALRHTDLSCSLLAELSGLACLTSLHLGNSSFSRHWLHFDEAVVPLLWSLGARLTSLNLERFSSVDTGQLGLLCPALRYLRLSCVGSYAPVLDLARAEFAQLQEVVILNTRGAHLSSRALLQLLGAAPGLRHAHLQFVESLSDAVWAELVAANPLASLETLTLDQCHSVSRHTLEDVVCRENKLYDLSCWSCRFISEADREALQTLIGTSNYDVHFSWYPFTGEEAPIPLDDIEDDEEEEEEEEQEDQDHEFLNYWNDPPLPGIGLR